MIELRMLPNQPPLTWNQFCVQSPPYAIALDGFVSGGPRFTHCKNRPMASFNHHEDVDRLATRATCAQVHIAIRQGLFDSFRDENGARAIVFANDCDQDVCLAWYLLREHHRAEPTMNALLNRLVGMEDVLDATAGAYPYPVELPLLRELAWIFEPYTLARTGGYLDQRSKAVFDSVVESVCARVDQHLMGAGRELPLDTRYRRLHNESAFCTVEEIGPHARTGMFANGIRAFVSTRTRGDGRWQYTVGRMSRYVRFDVPRILATLNEAEGLMTSADCWGGGDTIGGSPRVAGSGLNPEEVTRIVREVCS